MSEAAAAASTASTTNSNSTEDMKHGDIPTSATSDLDEMPFDWTTAAMEWPQNQFEAVPPLLPLCQPSNQSVLGVDLDMLMQNEAASEPFFEAMATPPPSPDSSSVVTSIKPNSMTFEITSNSNAVTASTASNRPRRPHHMACHDYTNKVHYQMPTLDPIIRPPAPTPATLVTSTTSSKRLTRHVVYNSQRPASASKYGRPPNANSKSSKRKSKASIDDPDYLAHGTGIPR